MYYFSFVLVFAFASVRAQSCEDLIKYVKNESYGTTYSSPVSEAISRVTFHSVTIEYTMYHFAIVCFKPSNYSYGCNEYIYRVGSNTRMNYAMNYLNSAGKAFWNYIQPHHRNLECSPDLS